MACGLRVPVPVRRQAVLVMLVTAHALMMMMILVFVTNKVAWVVGPDTNGKDGVFQTEKDHHLRVREVEVAHTTMFQNVCVDWNPDHRPAHLVLQGHGGEPPTNLLWITTTPTVETNKTQIWIQEPTLLLTGPSTNPNHLFWDVAVNLFAMMNHSSLPFTHWVIPDKTPCNFWLCQLLPVLLERVLHLDLKLLDLGITSDRVLCFHKVWVPEFAYYRAEQHAIPNYERVLLQLHHHLTRNFSKPSAQNTALFYGKIGDDHRRWRNVETEAARWNGSGLQQQQQLPVVVVDYVSDMSLLSFQQQCFHFWSVRHLVYVHGGHTANIICARPGTRINEMACPNYVGWSQDATNFHRILALDYHYWSVPNCYGHDDDFDTPQNWMDSWFVP